MKTGKHVEIYEPIVMFQSDAITIGDYVIISEFAHIQGGLGLYIGNFVHLATHSSITGGGHCILEDFVGVCAGTRIITGSVDVLAPGIPTPTIPDELREEYSSCFRSYIHCQKHSFLGSNVVVHPGVTIGEGAVVGSGSVVTKDVEPWTINLGIPTRIVKDRPKEDVLRLEKEVYAKCGVEPSNFSTIIEGIMSG